MVFKVASSVQLGRSDRRIHRFRCDMGAFLAVAVARVAERGVEDWRTCTDNLVRNYPISDDNR